MLAKLLCEAIVCILGEQILPFEQLEHTRRVCKIAKRRNMPHKIKKCPQIVLQVPLKISLKELRETKRWLKLIQRVPLIEPAEKLDSILEETEELIRIFVTSIKQQR